MIGHCLGVVAGGHGDHAAAAFAVAERGKLHTRAALLEGVGDLEILVFDENLGAGQGGERRRRECGRAQHMPGDHAPRRLDIGERHDRRASRFIAHSHLPAPGAADDNTSEGLFPDFRRRYNCESNRQGRRCIPDQARDPAPTTPKARQLRRRFG